MRRISILALIGWIILITVYPSLSQNTKPAMIQFWKESAKRGSIVGPFSLGYSYEHGQGVEKNLTEAAKWYLLGAERGDFQSALKLADMYLEGKGVDKDENRAIEWYTKVGKSESICAALGRMQLLILTRIYSLGGKGIEPDKVKAIALFDRLFEIETAIMDREEGKMQQSSERLNDSLNSLRNLMPKEK